MGWKRPSVGNAYKLAAIMCRTCYLLIMRMCSAMEPVLTQDAAKHCREDACMSADNRPSSTASIAYNPSTAYKPMRTRRAGAVSSRFA